MGKVKVVIIDNSIDITGALNAILGYAEFARDSFKFLFILPNGSRAIEKIEQKGFEVIEFSFVEISKNWKSIFMYFPMLLFNGIRLNKIIKSEKVKIVHVNDFYNLTAVMGKVLGGTFKLLTHVRFMPNRFPYPLVSFWIKLNLIYAEGIICVSKAVKNLLIDHPKIRVIYDGLPDFIDYPEKKEEKKGGPVRLLYLAHYIPGKGQDFALEAFAKAYEKNSKIRIRFVGGNMGMAKNRRFKAKLEKRAEELRVLRAVNFLGPVRNVQSEIMDADIMLNFSESESFSMTCLEALLCGVPLIASDCGGPSELFVHQSSGWLVPNKDTEEMYKAILQLSENCKIRSKLGVNSPKFVKKKFSSRNTYELLKNLYQNELS